MTMEGSLTDTNVKIDGTRFYKDLRTTSPVFFDHGYQAFLISRHDHIAHVLSEPRLFSSAQVYLQSYRFQDIITHVLDQCGHGAFNPVMADPPDHTRLRGISNLALSAKRVARLRGYIDGLTDDLLTDILPRGRMEVVSELAQPLAVRTIGDLLCLPRDRWRDVLRWTNAFTICAGNRLTSADHAEKIGHDLADFQNFIVSHLEERRSNPGDDLLSDLMSAKLAGHDPLNEKEILAIVAGLIGAGHETVTVAITELMRTLATQPELADFLRSSSPQQPAIMSICEEILRMRPPVIGIPRIAVADAEIAGIRIPAGARLLLLNASANRDASVFGNDADRLCPMRKNSSRHMTFGAGVHACQGNMLARGQLHAVSKAIIDRTRNLRLAGPEISASDYAPVIMDWNYQLTHLEIAFNRA
jgi:cytochrome P450